MTQSNSSHPTKTTRLNTTISTAAKERLIEMAGGERRVGQYIEQMIFERQFTKRIERLEESAGFR